MRIRHGENELIQVSNPDLTGYEVESAANGRLVIGHSETGAHHTVLCDKAKLYRKRGAEIAYLVMDEAAPLVHEGQRHKDVMLPAGTTWGISVKRQEGEEGSWAPVQD